MYTRSATLAAHADAYLSFAVPGVGCVGSVQRGREKLVRHDSWIHVTTSHSVPPHNGKSAARRLSSVNTHDLGAVTTNDWDG
jgi:hypothetical protein